MENGFNQFWKQTLQILILYGNYSLQLKFSPKTEYQIYNQ